MKMPPSRSLRLYVAGNSPSSMRARSNLAEIAQEHLAGNFTIEEVDVLKNPRQALADHILVTPTLLLLGAESPVRIIGNLNEREKVLNALGI